MSAHCTSELEQLVARHRGTWYAADPLTATGEALWHEQDASPVPAYLEHLVELGELPELEPWQLELARWWFR